MKKSILYSAIAIAITACSSGGGGDTAGIGGSGYTSSGTITGFSSIYVNGVKFDTSNSTISVDDSPEGGARFTLSLPLREDLEGAAADQT